MKEANKDIHQQTRQLMADAMIGILEERNRRRLDQHLAVCERCSQAAAAMREAVSGLRAVPVQADPALVTATRRSVRLYAERLREAESQKRMFLVSSALAAVAGAVSLPYLFRLFAWAGGLLQLPETVVLVVLLTFWLAPGLVAALAVSRRRRTADLHLAHEGFDRRMI